MAVERFVRSVLFILGVMAAAIILVIILERCN